MTGFTTKRYAFREVIPRQKTLFRAEECLLPGCPGLFPASGLSPDPRIAPGDELAEGGHRRLKVGRVLGDHLPVRDAAPENADRPHRGHQFPEAFMMLAARGDPDAVRRSVRRPPAERRD